MYNSDLLNLLLRFISSIPELDSFIAQNSEIKDMRSVVAMFKDKQIKDGLFDTEMDLKLKIILEKYSQLIESSDLGIHFINKQIQIDDSHILQQFANETNSLSSRKFKIINAEQQHYKTITEKIAFKEVDYSHIVDSYIEENHPFICSQIAIAYINAKRFDVGLVFLQKSLNHVFSSPNIYWHNPEAIFGCVDALYEFQHLLGRRGIVEFTFNFLECLYLYLSRAIYLCDFDSVDLKCNNDNIPNHIIKKINYLSLRADLIYYYRIEFASIFGIGVNPDIQFISDKATAHYQSMEYGLDLITTDCYNDALKMYRHGSLIPNNSGGYQDIEDDTFEQLVQRGQFRSHKLANKLFLDYNNSSFFISQSKVADYIGYLRDRCILQADISFSEYLDKRNAIYQKYSTLGNECDESSWAEYGKQYKIFIAKKANYIEFENYLKEAGVKCFYHFTDRRNLESIIKHKGLYSWQYCLDNGINVPKPGGGDLSKILDKKYGLEKYVRLSFCNDHPMAWRLKCENYDLVLLKIKIDVAWSLGTLFSDINAVDSAHKHGAALIDLKRININATKMRYLRKDDPNFKKHQAEVMVENFIPIEYIININNPDTV